MLSFFSIMKYLMIISIYVKFVYAADTTLQLINVVFRYGDATPIGGDTYPNDPYKADTFNPPGFGKLTERGKLRASELGKYLQKEYNEFLGNYYVPGSVYAQSTDTNRTKETLKLVMNEIYPGASIPTKVELAFEDILLLPHFCLSYIIAYNLMIMKSTIKQEMPEFKSLNENLTEWTGKRISTSFDMYKLYSLLEAESSMNLTLPSWTQGIFPDGDLLKGYILQTKAENYDGNLKRKNGGFLIAKFIEDVKAIKKGKENKKLILFSGHEFTITAVLQALGVYFPHAPKYSSAVILELHRIDNVYYVKIKYYKGIPAETMELTIPGCENLCPLDQFISLMKNVMPSEMDMLCGAARKRLGFIINKLKNYLKI